MGAFQGSKGNHISRVMIGLETAAPWFHYMRDRVLVGL